MDDGTDDFALRDPFERHPVFIEADNLDFANDTFGAGRLEDRLRVVRIQADHHDILCILEFFENVLRVFLGFVFFGFVDEWSVRVQRELAVRRAFRRFLASEFIENATDAVRGIVRRHRADEHDERTTVRHRFLDHPPDRFARFVVIDADVTQATAIGCVVVHREEMLLGCDPLEVRRLFFRVDYADGNSRDAELQHVVNLLGLIADGVAVGLDEHDIDAEVGTALLGTRFADRPELGNAVRDDRHFGLARTGIAAGGHTNDQRNERKSAESESESHQAPAFVTERITEGC